MKAPRWLRNEQRRLRRKFIKKLATRSYHTVDRWLDLEYLKAGIPVWIALLISSAEDLDPVNPWLIAALAISVPWWTLITIVIAQVYGRWGDKVYMTITRRMLSKEYRR